MHVKFVPERTDVAWESDRIAYRTYGQLLWQLENLHTSGVDVWMKRTRNLVTARQIGMYLCRELTDLSLPKIGQQFGGRDHTTVMYADRKINQLLAERRAVFNQVSELTNRVKMQARQG